MKIDYELPKSAISVYISGEFLIIVLKSKTEYKKHRNEIKTYQTIKLNDWYRRAIENLLI